MRGSHSQHTIQWLLEQEGRKNSLYQSYRQQKKCIDHTMDLKKYYSHVISKNTSMVVFVQVVQKFYTSSLVFQKSTIYRSRDLQQENHKPINCHLYYSPCFCRRTHKGHLDARTRTR